MLHALHVGLCGTLRARVAPLNCNYSQLPCHGGARRLHPLGTSERSRRRFCVGETIGGFCFGLGLVLVVVLLLGSGYVSMFAVLWWRELLLCVTGDGWEIIIFKLRHPLFCLSVCEDISMLLGVFKLEYWESEIEFWFF